jgi:hypothetical protein
MAPLINTHPMTMRAKQDFRLPADRLTLSATSASTLSPVPSSIHIALVDLKWHHTMEEEFAALIANNTWDVAPRLIGSNVFTDKWIFKHQFNSDGSLERYKTHWILCGFTQRLGVDYDETFNPVVKPATIRTVLSLAVSRSWPVHQLDVNNVFLHDTLSETIYCNQPTKFVDLAQPHHVCLLNKSLYVLKRSPQAW